MSWNVWKPRIIIGVAIAVAVVAFSFAFLPAPAPVGKPLDIKFTAIDGTPFDLAQFRGKVVLVDFWATWCSSCQEEIPYERAAYQKYHSRGFEIVGISLDEDKPALLKFTREKGMVWPQYYDGKGWDNAISTSFGIKSLPAMWLVNKEGILVGVNGDDDLDDQVQRLLAE